MRPRAVFAGLLLVLAFGGALVHAAEPAAEPQENAVPLLAQLSQRDLPPDRLGLETIAYLLDELGFKQRAALLRRFDERRAIAALLGETASSAATIGAAIAAEKAATPPLEVVREQLATRAVSLDFAAPGAALDDHDDPTRRDAKRISAQAKADLHDATAVAPGIWRAPAHALAVGHPELNPPLYFIRALASTHVGGDAIADLSLSLSGASLSRPAILTCSNQPLAAAAPVAVFCSIKRRTMAELSDADALAALTALQRGDATAVPTTLILTIGSAPHRRTFSKGMIAAASEDERNEAFAARMAATAMHKAASCDELGRCGERLVAAARDPGGIGLLVVLALMVWSASHRLSGSGPRPASTLARTAFALYALLVVIAAVLGVADAPGGSLCSGTGYCGLLRFIATGVAALPWSWLLLKSTTATSLDASDHVTLAVLWLGIGLNLLWLGIMAFAGGDRGDAIAARRPARRSV